MGTLQGWGTKGEIMKEAVSKKKDGHRVKCRNSTEENRRGIKAWQIKQRKQFQKQLRRRLKRY